MVRKRISFSWHACFPNSKSILEMSIWDWKFYHPGGPEHVQTAGKKLLAGTPCASYQHAKQAAVLFVCSTRYFDRKSALAYIPKDMEQLVTRTIYECKLHDQRQKGRHKHPQAGSGGESSCDACACARRALAGDCRVVEGNVVRSWGCHRKVQVEGRVADLCNCHSGTLRV